MDFPEDLKPKKQAPLTPEQALVKGRAWCAFQERCHQDTRLKLFSWGLKSTDVDQVIAQLISEGFLNEERFAIAFAGGKFRVKHWGKQKIRVELKKKKVSEPCIRGGLASIDDKDYMASLKIMFAKRQKEIKDSNPWQRRAKIANFLIGKGYEPELVNSLFREEEY
jgi:regulatory protein